MEKPLSKTPITKKPNRSASPISPILSKQVGKDYSSYVPIRRQTKNPATPNSAQNKFRELHQQRKALSSQSKQLESHIKEITSKARRARKPKQIPRSHLSLFLRKLNRFLASKKKKLLKEVFPLIYNLSKKPANSETLNYFNFKTKLKAFKVLFKQYLESKEHRDLGIKVARKHYNLQLKVNAFSNWQQVLHSKDNINSEEEQEIVVSFRKYCESRQSFPCTENSVLDTSELNISMEPYASKVGINPVRLQFSAFLDESGISDNSVIEDTFCNIAKTHYEMASLFYRGIKPWKEYASYSSKKTVASYFYSKNLKIKVLEKLFEHFVSSNEVPSLHYNASLLKKALKGLQFKQDPYEDIVQSFLLYTKLPPVFYEWKEFVQQVKQEKHKRKRSETIWNRLSKC